MESILTPVLLVLVFALGAMFGSFLNVVIFRLPNKENFVTGGSSCPRCKHKLGALDLVPILSYLFLGRRCRYCKESISPRYLLIELLAGALAVVSYLAFMPPAGFLLATQPQEHLTLSAKEAGLVALWLPFDLPALSTALAAVILTFALLCVLIVVTFIDADTMEIPNALSIWIALLGLAGMVLGPTAQLPWYDHLIGALAVSVPMFILAFLVIGSFGLGDVKLMAAAGLLLGWQLVLVATLIGIFIGGAYGIFLLVTRKKGRKDHFAFGPSLCAGIALSMFAGNNVLAWYLGFF